MTRRGLIGGEEEGGKGTEMEMKAGSQFKDGWNAWMPCLDTAAAPYFTGNDVTFGMVHPLHPQYTADVITFNFTCR